MTRSEWALREVEVCVQSERTPIVIDIDGAFLTQTGHTEQERERSDKLRSLLDDFIRIEEQAADDHDSVYDGPPSEYVVNELNRTFNATRQDTRRSRVFAGIAAMLALLSAATIVLGLQAQLARSDAEASRDRLASQVADDFAEEAMLQSAPEKPPFLPLHLALSSAQECPANDPAMPYHIARVIHLAASLPNRIVKLEGLNESLIRIVLTSDQQLALAITESGRVRIWELATGRQIPVPIPTTESVMAPDPVTGDPDTGWSSLAFSDSGEFAKAFTADTTLWIWNAKNGTVLWSGDYDGYEKKLPEEFASQFPDPDEDESDTSYELVFRGRRPVLVIPDTSSTDGLYKEREGQRWLTFGMTSTDEMPDAVFTVTTTGTVLYWDQANSSLQRKFTGVNTDGMVAGALAQGGSSLLILKDDGKLQQHTLDWQSNLDSTIGRRSPPIDSTWRNLADKQPERLSRLQ